MKACVQSVLLFMVNTGIRKLSKCVSPLSAPPMFLQVLKRQVITKTWFWRLDIFWMDTLRYCCINQHIWEMVSEYIYMDKHFCVLCAYICIFILLHTQTHTEIHYCRCTHVSHQYISFYHKLDNTSFIISADLEQRKNAFNHSSIFQVLHKKTFQENSEKHMVSSCRGPPFINMTYFF